MTAWVGWAVTAAGSVVVLAALRDIFHTLWHPSGRGDIARSVMAAVWWAGRAGSRRGALAGPLAMVAVVLTWAVLVVLGGALVYWPHLPGSFSLDSALAPDRGGFPDALYLSLVTTATLGFGDIVPTASWLRIAVPAQALVGFGLLTAAVTWVLQLYPTLIRRRALAVRLASLRRLGSEELLTSREGVLAVQVLDGLAVQFAQARVDMTEYAETYYFREGTQEAALPAMVSFAVELADRAAGSPCVDVRLAGRLLAHALEDYAVVVNQEFLHREGSVRELLQAYADDHGHRQVG